MNRKKRVESCRTKGIRYMQLIAPHQTSFLLRPLVGLFSNLLGKVRSVMVPTSSSWEARPGSSCASASAPGLPRGRPRSAPGPWPGWLATKHSPRLPSAPRLLYRICLQDDAIMRVARRDGLALGGLLTYVLAPNWYTSCASAASAALRGGRRQGARARGAHHPRAYLRPLAAPALVRRDRPGPGALPAHGRGPRALRRIAAAQISLRNYMTT